MFCYNLYLDFPFNGDRRITGANKNSWLGTMAYNCYKNTNLILNEWMNYQVLSLYDLHLFCRLAAVSPLGKLWKLLLFSLRLQVCVVAFIHEKRKLAVFFYHDQDTFDFSQGHVTNNQPMAVPVLVEWKSRNITVMLIVGNKSSPQS